MIADELLDEVDTKVSALSYLIVGETINKMAKEVEKGHRKVDNCAYCVALTNYVRLQIALKRAIRKQRDSFSSWPNTNEWSGQNELERRIRHAKRIKDSLK